MFDFSVEGMPSWLKGIVWLALGIAALVSVWRNLHGGDFLKVATKELHGNSKYREEMLALNKAQTEAIAAVKVTIANIEAQFKTNGGGTLKDSQNFLIALIKVLLQQNEAGVFITDVKGNRTFVNDSIARRLNCNSSMFLGNGWVSLLTPDKQKYLMDYWNECVTFHRFFDREMTYEYGDKSVKVHCVAYPLRTEIGDFLGMAGRCTVIP